MMRWTGVRPAEQPICVDRLASERCWLVAAVLVLAGARPAAAAPSREVVVVASAAACPSPRALAAALGAYLPSRRVRVGGPAAGAAEVRVADLGKRYAVQVKGERKEFDDPRRRCGERARAAAVFASVALEPPTVAGRVQHDADAEAEAGGGARPQIAAASSHRAATTVAAAPVAAPASASPPTQAGAGEGGPSTGTASATAESAPGAAAWLGGPLRIELEMEGRGAFSADSPVLGAGGGAFRFLAGGRHIMGSLGVSALSAASWTVASAEARLWRVPFDFDVRVGWRVGRMEVAAEGGMVVELVNVRGQGFPLELGSTLWEVGLHAGAQLRVHLGERLAPYVAVDVTELPRSHPLSVDGVEVGHTPRTWLSVALGLAIRMKP